MEGTRIMTPQQALNHAVLISRWNKKPFEWGKTDCMQFLFEWHDYVFKTGLQKKIFNQYHSRLQAARFWHKYPMSCKQWMTLNNFVVCEDDLIQEGDVLLTEDLYPQAFIYHNGAWWSPKEDDEFRSYDVNNVNNYTKWRKKNG